MTFYSEFSERNASWPLCQGAGNGVLLGIGSGVSLGAGSGVSLGAGNGVSLGAGNGVSLGDGVAVGVSLGGSGVGLGGMMRRCASSSA